MCLGKGYWRVFCIILSFKIYLNKRIMFIGKNSMYYDLRCYLNLILLKDELRYYWLLIRIKI